MDILGLSAQFPNARFVVEEGAQSHGGEIGMAHDCLAELFDAMIEVKPGQVRLDGVVLCAWSSVGGFS